MTRATVNLLLDGLLLVLLMTVLFISFVVRFIFPPGPRAAGWTLWGQGYDGWCQIQFVSIAVFAVGILVHLILHWGWVCKFVAAKISRFRRRAVVTNEATSTIYGVSLLVLVLTVLGGVLLWAELGIHGPAH